MNITLHTCTLREWREGDEASLAYHADNRNIWNNVRDLFPSPYSPEAAEWWIREGCKAPNTLSFAIEVDGNAVGGIGLIFKEDIYRRSAEIGYWLGQEYWGRGITTEAVRAVTEYGFAHFDLCRIYACVFEWNVASMRVLEKAGFAFEARLRKSVTKNDQSIDDLIYAVVR